MTQLATVFFIAFTQKKVKTCSKKWSKKETQIIASKTLCLRIIEQKPGEERNKALQMNCIAVVLHVALWTNRWVSGTTSNLALPFENIKPRSALWKRETLFCVSKASNLVLNIKGNLTLSNGKTRFDVVSLKPIEIKNNL